MILTKEHGGQIYVADIGPSKGPETMGDILQPWTAIGPGERPVVSMDDSTYYLAFEYLGHVYVRRMENNVWPPLVIDPTTYTPHISLEEPHDAFALGGEVAPGAVVVGDFPYLEGPHSAVLERVTGIIRDTTTGRFSIQLQRKVASPIPSPATFQAWRVYARPVGGAWALLTDWQPEVGAFTLSASGSLCYDVALTFGDLWSASGVNTDVTATHLYRESMLGASLHLDSTTEPLTVQSSSGDTTPCPWGVSSPSGVTFGGSQAFYSVPGEDTAALSAQADFGSVLPQAPWSSAFLTGNATRGWADFADQWGAPQGVGVSPSSVIVY